MKNPVPRASVVMPSYNEETFIAKAIESLVDDYFLKNCELLIVDGMSSDGTQEVVQSFIKKGLRIRLLENKKKDSGLRDKPGNIRGERRDNC
ncbi:hypothetical protein ES703_101949 [subsurface metagenome]